MKFEVVVSDDVRAELEAASDWYRKQSLSLEVASRWLQGFQSVIASLETNPDRFSVAHESSLFPYPLRELRYGSGRRKTHRALFRIVGNRVEVMAICHLAQRDLTPDDL